MPPLNPFLRAFFRSALPGQCSPIAHHVILCPTTDVLLNAKDRETGTQYAELALTEEFLSSHVLRVPGGGKVDVGGGVGKGEGASAGAGAGAGNVRESKGKAKQYSTINGRTVVVKDTFVYSNKGFKTLNQAQLLQDIIYYPDVADGQQWLVYYISRPLIGNFLATPVLPAVISDEPSKERRTTLAEASASPTAGPSGGKKKDIKSFGNLMLQFPMISRQMQSGLARIIREFVAANDQPLPKKSSRRSSISSQNSNPSLSGSITSLKSSLSGGSRESTVHPTAIELEPEEEIMRSSLETAITKAIELFQSVDKAQLSLLGASTVLTGPVVEHMIERYVTEQVHDQTLFRRVCAIRKADDSDLESKIRRMADVDIAQVGIPIEDGMRGKRMLAARLVKGVEAFRKMGVASSPQEMLEILLQTQRFITETASTPATEADQERESQSEKTPTALTVNADILVSMLLIVVIRSGVRHLHSRLLYMRYFIFIDEVESGEQGYALATLEAVLTHLTNASGFLRKASKRNRALWQAAKSGDMQAMEAILQPSMIAPSEATVVESPKETLEYEDTSDDEQSTKDFGDRDEAAEGASHTTQNGNFVAVNGSLEHVFPFEKPPTPPPEQVEARGKKRVSMASLPRSGSTSSAYSSRSHSRHLSTDSAMSVAVGGDLSTERLAQTQDADGNSVLMMAVEAGEPQALRFLLSMPAHFRSEFVLDDVNSDGATLLNATVQSGNRLVTDELISYIDDHTSHEELRKYLAIQDGRGRCMAHYLFTQPHLIRTFGEKLPWRLKDKNGQTPLFALCRSYDHEEYHSMVDAAMSLTKETQGDGQPLHLDDHVDAKGNTLLHIVNDASLVFKLLRHCDSDVNAANDKRFTPLMVGSKYGRVDLVRALFGDPRVDMTLKDVRGLSAVELAKDDDVRNRIDDLILLSTPPGQDGRMTAVVRSFFVEDATIRFVLKSGEPNPNGTITVTTCRRTVADFENLSKWLSIECPASWIPTQFNMTSPFLVPSKPSRAVLRDTQIRIDNFFHALLTHGTFSTHELVWEFFLVPEVDETMLAERSKRKADSRIDNIKDDYEPITDTAEVETFVSFARDQMRGVLSSTKKLTRSTNRKRMTYNDFSESTILLSNRINTLLFLPQPYLTAIDRYARTLIPTEATPMNSFYYTLHSIQSTGNAIKSALDRPAILISNMSQTQRSIDRSMGSITRSNRWTPNIGLFEDTRKQVAQEAWEKASKGRAELETLGCELRYTQQTVAGELASWQEEHVRQGRAMLRRLAKETIVRERARLEGMRRALREIQKVKL